MYCTYKKKNISNEIVFALFLDNTLISLFWMKLKARQVGSKPEVPLLITGESRLRIVVFNVEISS